MIKEEKYINDTFGKDNHFQVPAGYFDGLADRIMAQISEQDASAPSLGAQEEGTARMGVLLASGDKNQTLWQRLPWRKMAAAVAAVVVVGSGVVAVGGRMTGAGSSQQAQPVAQVNSSASQEADSEEANFEQMVDYAMMDTQDFYAQLVAEN